MDSMNFAYYCDIIYVCCFHNAVVNRVFMAFVVDLWFLGSLFNALESDTL
jgi:hypothetical protein